MGLTDKEVVLARKEYGSNKITHEKQKTFINLLIEALGDPIIKILLIALAVKLVFLFKNFDWYETIGILASIFLATFISSISEYGADKAFNKLQNEMLNTKVVVKRNNKLQEILLEDVVVKDIVYLQSGDKICADGKIINGSIGVDESLLNGEAEEIKKDINNIVYRGSTVLSGSAIMEVINVGDKTLFGGISKELQSSLPISPLKEKLRDLAKTISKIGYIGALLASISYLFSSIVIANNFDTTLILSTLKNIPVMFNHLIYALTLCVTIIVVTVPEGLPMMITLVLSSNMKRMLKDNVLVRKLVGIETSGSLNILFTDKTGTLTKGSLKVTEFVSSDLKKYKDSREIKNSLIYDIIYKSFIYNNECKISNGNIFGGNQTDRAIYEFMEYDPLKKDSIINKEIFSSEKKYSSITLNDGTIFIKGAKEVILPLCKNTINSQGLINNNINKNQIENKIKTYTKNCGRVITFAFGKDLNSLTYIGFINIKDELRKEAYQGIKLIKNAGVDIIMITGDALDTAKEIAKEVGLITPQKYLCLTSEELNKLSDEEISKKLKNIAVIARALPKDKSRLVNIAISENLVAGMTGDGLNDAPALKKANVGFAMGSACEVAKEASDIVIIDNNILSISKAILYGRTIFKSIRKFIIYQLTVNMCALILSIAGSLIGIQTPITIVQMLWLNMIMDTFAGIAFSFEYPMLEYMEEAPKKKNEKIINKYMYSEIIISGLYCAIICILFLKLPIVRKIVRVGYNNKYLMTSYFAMFIFMGIFNAFNSRSTRLNILSGLNKNKVFLIVFSFIFVAQIYIIYYGHDIFRTYGLTFKELIFVFIISLTVFPIDFLRKYILKKKHIALRV